MRRRSFNRRSSPQAIEKSPGRGFAVNGKFLAHALTGTERYAFEVGRRICAASNSCDLWIPRDVHADQVPPWAKHARLRRGLTNGMLFEQFELPIRTAGKVLISMGGPAPLVKRAQVAVIHDVLTFRQPHVFSRRFGAFYRLMYRSVSFLARDVVTVSQFSATEIASVLPRARAKMTVAPCGSDHFAELVGVRPRGAPEGEFVVCVGTLAPHKNVGPVAKALVEADITLVLVGAIGKSRIFPETNIDDDTPNLHLLGRLEDCEIAWLYDHALAAVCPSRYEGFGLPLLEAQVRGCPVVAADSGAALEVGASGVRFFPADDVGEALVQVQRLGQDTEARALLAANARINAARYGWDTTARNILGLIALRTVRNPAA